MEDTNTEPSHAIWFKAERSRDTQLHKIKVKSEGKQMRIGKKAWEHGARLRDCESKTVTFIKTLLLRYIIRLANVNVGG